MREEHTWPEPLVKSLQLVAKTFARSNLVARVNDDCSACGTCIDRCMFNALSLGDGHDQVQIDEDRCWGAAYAP